MVRRMVVLSALVLSLLWVPSAHAASIFLPDPATNGLFAIAFNPAGDPPPDSVVADLSGASIGTIVDDDGVTVLAVNVAAPANPGDPDIGSGLLLATETPAALSITFDFASAIFGDNGLLTLIGTGTPLTPLDAALAAFNGQVFGSFLLASSVPVLDGEGEIPVGSIDSYLLQSIVGANEEIPPTPVPEPATMTLLGIGLAGAAARRMKKRA